tara:strand:- start:2198 stop:2407 length:210 start_codon:yes stop_codon:yes gene_type:complete
MKFGGKRMMRYSLGVKTGLHHAGKFGSKASAMMGYAAPVALMMGQPEIASALEAGSAIGKGVSNIIKEI